MIDRPLVPAGEQMFDFPTTSSDGLGASLYSQPSLDIVQPLRYTRKLRQIPVLPERVFSPFLNLRNSLHCMESGLRELAVIANGNISALLKIDCRIL